MATISGGVIVGSSSSISENPVIALTLGACSGIISYLLIHFTFQRINAKWFVMTHEIFAMFVVNGFFGGVASSVVLASYIGTASERTLYFSRQSGQNTIPTDSSYQVTMFLTVDSTHWCDDHTCPLLWTAGLWSHQLLQSRRCRVLRRQ